ncbi:hypothetical protein POTOM_029180 [Populus tomentosa]|uniref:Uncharacterized protein n=1 Tax=Populus tomentosa TaxID=118781 RepID=A0A8X7ZCB3_POPTO|nr:hypothetical protein POTOM_029180 [Populus tomentosa]
MGLPAEHLRPGSELAIIDSGPQTPPAPRFDHTYAINGDLYLLIFGGCSHSIFFNDLLVLDFRLKSQSQRTIHAAEDMIMRKVYIPCFWEGDRLAFDHS